MKRIITVILGIVLACTLISCDNNLESTVLQPTSSLTDIVNTEIESPAEDFEYRKSDDGQKIHITKYIGKSENVVIPSKIEDLPVYTIEGITNQNGITVEGAFENTNVKTVVIPDSVASIGSSAFANCKQLECISITSNSNLQIISSNAFTNCTALKKIDLSLTKIKTIDILAFSGCAYLKEIKLPNSVEKIGRKAFYECSSLSEINLPESLTTLGEASFAYCKALKKVTIPSKLDLVMLHEPAFYENTSLEQIVFQDGREEIKGYAFFAINTNVMIFIPQSIKNLSLLSFITTGENAKINLQFSGDCPIITDENNYSDKITIYYDPTTEGWEELKQNSTYPIKPTK